MEFTLVADARLVESKALFDQKRYHGSIYMVGYAIEVKLKELQFKTFGNFTHIHSLQILFHKNNIASSFYKSDKWESLFIDFWDVEMRYREDDFTDITEDEVKKIYVAACRLFGKINRRLV